MVENNRCTAQNGLFMSDTNHTKIITHDVQPVDECRVQAELNRLFCEQTQISGRSGIICTLTLAAMILPLRYESTVVAWAVALSLVYALRYVWIARLLRRNPDAANRKSTRTVLGVSIFLTGIGWGVAAGFFVWPGTPVTGLPFLLIMMAMLVISAPLLSTRPNSYLFFMAPLLAGILLHLCRMGVEEPVTTFIIVCSVTCFAGCLAYETHRMTRESVLLRLEKEAIFDKLVEAKQHAERTAAAKGAFLATMSHEIRTPINGLMGMLEILKETKPTSTQMSYINTASRSAESLLQLLNDILDYSKLEVGRLEIERVPFDWMDLTGETAMMHRYLASNKGISFHLELPAESTPVVMGDPTRLRQILNNLLSNALKFTPEGNIWLKVAASDNPDGTQTLRFSVRDSGIGIEPEAQKRLFNQFQQADASTSRKYGGTGLGLAISQQLAHLMGGEITLVSEPGKGSEFTFAAPFARSTPEALHACDADKPEKVDHFDAKVLLVEDDPVSQSVATLMLKGYGIKPIVVGTGKAAVERTAREPFDLIFMDSHLPDQDGFEVAKFIRSHRSVTAPPPYIVAMTGADTPEDRDHAKECGMSDFIAKPVRKSDILACLRRWTLVSIPQQPS
jgi:signal transduction histidine kinase/CheY-like chemotaxis protein